MWQNVTKWCFNRAKEPRDEWIPTKWVPSFDSLFCNYQHYTYSVQLYSVVNTLVLACCNHQCNYMWVELCGIYWLPDWIVQAYIDVRS
jgi:hypothetical protein